MTKHVHQWGPWLSGYWGVPRGRLLRLCVSGWCPAGQYRNGRVFTARSERRAS